ncbi:MAG: hypothetical protein Q9174_005756 [Haloplaca sp. 1 TL-2023]
MYVSVPLSALFFMTIVSLETLAIPFGRDGRSRQHVERSALLSKKVTDRDIIASNGLPSRPQMLNSTLIGHPSIPPEDFNIELRWYSAMVCVSAAYINTIEVLAELAVMNFNGIQPAVTIEGHGPVLTSMDIDINGRGSSDPLVRKYAIWGVFGGIVAMAEARHFYSLQLIMRFRGGEVGQVFIRNSGRFQSKGHDKSNPSPEEAFCSEEATKLVLAGRERTTKETHDRTPTSGDEASVPGALSTANETLDGLGIPHQFAWRNPTHPRQTLLCTFKGNELSWRQAYMTPAIALIDEQFVVPPSGDPVKAFREELPDYDTVISVMPWRGQAAAKFTNEWAIRSLGALPRLMAIKYTWKAMDVTILIDEKPVGTIAFAGTAAATA